MRFTPVTDRPEVDVLNYDPVERRSYLQAHGSGSKLSCENIQTNIHMYQGREAMVQPVATDHVDVQFPDSSGSYSVSAVRLMDHGACSYVTSLQAIQSQVKEGLYWGFVSEVGQAPEPDRLVEYYLDTVSYLDHTPGVPLDVRGGFFVDFSFGIEFNEPVPNVRACFGANYRFLLYDGIGGVKPALNQGMVTGYSGAVDGVFDGLSEALLTTIPSRLYEAFRDQQTSDVGGAVCTFGQQHDCDLTAAVFALEVRSKGANIGLQLLEQDALIAAANAEAAANDPVDPACIDPSATGVCTTTRYRNWRCVPVAGGTDGKGECQFVARAKRLNVYSDELELVWFDGEELDNPTYALWVAAHGDGTGAGDATGELCQWQAGPPPTDVYWRHPVWSQSHHGTYYF